MEIKFLLPHNRDSGRSSKFAMAVKFPKRIWMGYLRVGADKSSCEDKVVWMPYLRLA